MRTAAILAALTVTGCAFLIVGKDNFKSAALHRAGTFAVNYQAMYRCFTEKNPTNEPPIPIPGAMGGPTAQLYPDLSLAEYKMVTRNDAWSSLIEFRKSGATSTEVEAWDISEYILNGYWASVEACGRGGGK